MGEYKVIHDALDKINSAFGKIENAANHSISVLDRMQTHLDIAFGLTITVLVMAWAALVLGLLFARSSVGSEQQISNPQVAGSNPAERTNSPDPER